MKQLILLIGLFFFIQTAKSQVSYTWNGSVSTAWNTAANWTPSGIPGSIDNVTIVTGGNTCTLNANSSITNITLTSGTLDLGGFTLTAAAGATATFTKGTVQNGILSIPAAATTTFGNGPTVMNCTVNIASATITIKNTTFQNLTNITKTGVSNDNSPGGNIFNGVTTMTNSGPGQFLLANGNPDQFNNTTTFNNTGSNNFYIAYNAVGNVFGGVTTFNNAPSTNNGIYVSWVSTGTVFNNNIVVSSTSGSGVQFSGGSGTASTSLSTGNTIAIGAGGFSAGTLLLRQFSQIGATAQNLTLTGAGALAFGPGSAFQAAITASSPTLYLNGCTFVSSSNLTKTGASGDFSNGGNAFNGVCSITNSGSSYLVLGNNNPDTWNSDVTFTDNGSERLLPCWASAGNQFNGNIIVNTSGSAQGIQFCGGNTTATATLAATKTVQAGGTGLTAGYLYLKQFTQLGNAPITLSASGTSVLYLGPNSIFGGAFTVTAPDIWAQGATYNSTAVFTKTGGSSNHNNQNQNIFNSTCTINQFSSGGYFMLGYNSNDQFNDNIILNSTGTGGIYLGWQSGTGTPTMIAGKTITVGAGGFSAGFLSLNTFTQLGNTPMNLTLTGANTSLTFARSSVIGGNLTASSPDIFLNGATFNGTTNLTKTGAGGDFDAGGNTFTGVSTLINSSSGYWVLGNNNPDTWNNDVTLTDNGSERLLPCWASAGNQFNGNIFVNTSGSAQGIQFCGGNGTATATLAAGKTIQAGAGGLNAGYLQLRQFTQLGNTAVNLTLGSTSSYLQFGPSSTIGGDLVSTSPGLYFNGCIFNGAVTATKNGASNENGSGNDIFNGITVITNSGAGQLLMSNGGPDQFYNTTTFNNTGSNNFHVGYNSSGNVFGGMTTFNNATSSNNGIYVSWLSAGTVFNNNIIVTSTSGSGVQFCGGNGTATASLFAGSTISVGAAGFSAGTLLLRQFTQVGATAQNLPLTGTANMTFGPSSAFGGDVTSSSPTMFLNGATFSGIANITKTGSTGDYSQGGNVFNGVSSITNSGSSFFLLGNNNPDTWNNDVTFTDNGSERLLPCWATTGNQFNGNIFVNTSGSAQGIQFCGGNNTATATLAAGKAIQTGAGGLNAGYLILRQFTQLGNTPVNLTLSGTATYLQYGPLSTLGGDVVSSSPGLFFNGCTFNGAVTTTKNGASNDNSSGNNIFNGVTVITNNGSGQLLLGNGNLDQFNTTATFNNTGANNIQVGYNSPNNVFGGVTTFNNAPTANTGIYVSWYSAGTVFNDNIVVTSTSGQGVQFCGGNGTSTVTLAAGKTISIGAAGFSGGALLLRQFTQLGNAAVNLTLSPTATYLQYGPSSAFGGDVTSSSPTLFLHGCTFSRTTNITKTGTTGDYSNGGNVFNGVSSITNSGSSFLLLGNTNPDIWNNDVTFTDNGSERLLPCWATVGNQFNGNIFVNTSGSAQGIQFCGGNNTATATLAATKTIQAGAGGLNAGYLILRQFTQLGNAPVSLNLASTATYLQYGPLSALGGDVVSTSPGLYFNGCTFGGAATCTKTGASSDNSSGNNIFNGVALMTNTGTGYLLFGNGNRDQFNTTATFNNTGGNNIFVAYNSSNNIFGGVTTFNNAPSTNNGIYVSWYSTGTVFNDNIVATSTSGTGVQFCGANTTATATLSAGKTISVGAAGFSAGTLLLRQFTQTGATAQNLTLTGSGNLTFGPSSAFGGNTTTISPTLFFNGCNFGGTVTSAKNGTSSDASTGNNTFNGAFIITNTGNGYFLMGNGNPDTWQSTAVFNNLSPASHLYTAYSSTGNIFNGDVTFNNQPGTTGLWIYPNNSGISTQFNGNIIISNVNGGGVYFGNGTGTATLTGGALSIGAGGFNTGGLLFRNFTQTGSGVAQNLTTTGTSYIQFGSNSSFDGAVTSTSPGLFFNGCKFNGIVNSTKNGTNNDQSQGNNIFNGVSTFTNNGTGYLLMTVTSPDAYNNDANFVQNNTGLVYPNYNNNSTYTGNVTLTSPSATSITFGSGTGTATFSGSGSQSINATGATAVPVFTRLVIANTGAGVTLNTPVNVLTNLQLTSGLLNSSTTNILTMLNGSTTAVGTALSTSYVNGPMRYIKSTSGATTLNFPVGSGADSRPVALTVNHTNTTTYIYQTQLFNLSALLLNYTLPPSIDRVSNFHYYTIGRFNAAMVSQPSTGLVGNQTIQIFFGANDSVSNGATLTIVKNTSASPTAWINIGGAGGPTFTGSGGLIGSITSTSSPTAFNSFSTFALADQIGGGNVLPVGLLNFHAKINNSVVDLDWATSTESNNNYFTIERSRDGANFEFVQKVNSQAINGNSTSELDYTAQDPNPYPGVSYYRLKQTDLDGKSRYSTIVSVNFDKKQLISCYPNPTTGTVYIGGLDNSVTSLKAEWFDVSGKLLLGETVSVQNGVARLDAHFNNGVYLLRFIASDGTFKLQNVIIMK